MVSRVVYVLLGLALLSCGPAPAPVDSLAARKREVLASLGENVFLPTYRRFADAAADLEAATDAYATDPTADNRAAAQQAWIDAMAVWQEAELFAFGPEGPPGGIICEFIGERMLRDSIYSFPATSTCGIDGVTVSGPYDDPDMLAEQLLDTRGLDAIEYLLFVESTENTCPSSSDLNAMGTWAALGADEVAARRADYAHAAAVLVSRAASELRDAWEPDGDDFLGALATAGDGSALFPTAHLALTELSSALLYADAMTKDMKVGEPAGLLSCSTGDCADELESPWSGRSLEHVRINVRTLRRIYLGADPGTDAPGYDDLLVDAGSPELASQLATELDEAVAAFEGLGPTLEEAIASDPDAVTAAYDQLGEALRLFKTDLVSVLDVSTSSCIASDSD